MFSFDNRSYSLFEKKFVAGYQFMKVERNGADTVYRIDWKDVILILEIPMDKILKNQTNRFVYLRFRDCFAAFVFVNQRFKYDGTDDTLRTDSLDKNKFRNRPVLPQKERDLGNRPDGYKTMGVAFLL